MFAAPFDVVFADMNVVEPDVLYISRERLDVPTDQHVRGTPGLVVEILSAGTRKMDEVKKRELYERFGVREYWIIDPEVDTVTVFRNVAGALARAGELRAGEVLRTPLLPDLSIALPEIFAL